MGHVTLAPILLATSLTMLSTGQFSWSSCHALEGCVVMKGTDLVYTTLMLTAMISFAILVFEIVALFLG
jgi:hypothetical protein